MTRYNYDKKLSSLITPEIMNAVGTLREYRGKQALYRLTRPHVLESLVEIAKIQSTDMSNRIENISTTDKRLREMMLENAEPKTRDEREIAGYRYVLDQIHESHQFIPLSPNMILQLHRDLYAYDDVSFAGHWKDSDNVIAERTADGKLVTRFKPTSAAATPGAIERICLEYSEQIEKGVYDPVLVALVFSFDFVSIHPFNDGNGRMSRLLTLLSLYRNNYTIGKYISIEKEIERTKETYYEALAASSKGWEKGKNDYTPYVTYMLGVLTACYKELGDRIGLLGGAQTNEEALRAYFEQTLAPVTKYEIMNANPTMSQRTIERILGKLQQEGTLEKVGAARATKYRWNREGYIKR